MAELRGFDRASIAVARQRGRQERATDARHVTYVPESDSISIVLRNRTVVFVPRTAIDGLKASVENASHECAPFVDGRRRRASRARCAYFGERRRSESCVW